VSDDVRGRIYRIVYRGGSATDDVARSITSCPSPSAPAGEIVAAAVNPPEGTHPDAGAAAATDKLPVAPGATRAMVALGERIFHGQVGGATCTGCHGANGRGTPLGPDLTHTRQRWDEGGYATIAKTVTDGVPQPKRYRSPMPPMGGAQLSADQVSAVAAYVWSLSHSGPAGSGSHVSN
jgi:mono/diheme cytochrome c family protein